MARHNLKNVYAEASLRREHRKLAEDIRHALGGYGGLYSTLSTRYDGGSDIGQKILELLAMLDSAGEE